jgi:PleD family two-component response regulator
VFSLRKEPAPVTQKLRVLVAERSSEEAAAVLRELFSGDPDGPELTEVSGVSMLMASLKLVNPEAILLELVLASPDPLEIVRLLHRANPDVPLIVIGDPSEKEAAAASLNKGATG